MKLQKITLLKQEYYYGLIMISNKKVPLINICNDTLNRVSNVDHDSVEALKDYTARMMKKIESSNCDAFSSIQNPPSALLNDSDCRALLTLPLNGMCFAAKEVIDVDGHECNFGCNAFKGRIPQTNAEIVNKLKDLGAQLVGITRSTELAIAKETSTVNPWSKNHTPGGSSSGSAAAVGEGLIPFALGTQTIGSIIRPAAYCGVIGFKPSKNLGSLVGVLKLSSTLDHLGYFSDSLERLITTLSLLYPKEFLIPPKQKKQEFRIVFVQPWFALENNSTWESTVHKIKEWAINTGIEYLDIAIQKDIADQEEKITNSILCFEMFEEWKDSLFNNVATSDFLQSFLQKGKNTSVDEYQHCLVQQKQMMENIESLLDDSDIIVFPSVTGLPPKLGDGTGSRDTQRLWTLLGMPALNLPIGVENNFPNNLQLIAKKGKDQFLLETAKYINDSISFNKINTIKTNHV